MRGGSAGGGDSASVSTAMTTLLQQNAGSYTWVAATTGSMAAAPYQLATGEPVMAIGGFTGSDDAPTLAQFQADVAAGKIHYFIASGSGGRGGFGGAGGQGSSTANEITSWVTSHATATTVGGITLYDLSNVSG